MFNSISRNAGKLVGSILSTAKWLVGGAYAVSAGSLAVGGILTGTGAALSGLSITTGVSGIGASAIGFGLGAAGATTGFIAGIGMILPPVGFGIAAFVALPAIVGGFLEVGKRAYDSYSKAQGAAKILSVISSIVFSPINFASGFFKTASNMYQGKGWLQGSLRATNQQLNDEFKGEENSITGPILPLRIKRVIDRITVGPVVGLFSGLAGGFYNAGRKILESRSIAEGLGNLLFLAAPRIIAGPLQGLYRGFYGSRPGLDTFKHINAPSDESAVGVFSDVSKYSRKRAAKKAIITQTRIAEDKSSVNEIMQGLTNGNQTSNWTSSRIARVRSNLIRENHGLDNVPRKTRNQLDKAADLALEKESLEATLPASTPVSPNLAGSPATYANDDWLATPPTSPHPAGRQVNESKGTAPNAFGPFNSQPDFVTEEAGSQPSPHQGLTHRKRD